MSTSYHWGDGYVLSLVSSSDPPPGVRVWIDMGTAEDHGDADRNGVPDLIDEHRRIRDALMAHGLWPGATLEYVEDDNARHDERAWAARLPGASAASSSPRRPRAETGPRSADTDSRARRCRPSQAGAATAAGPRSPNDGDRARPARRDRVEQARRVQGTPRRAAERSRSPAGRGAGCRPRVGAPRRRVLKPAPACLGHGAASWAAPHGLEPVLDEAFNNIDLGVWQGKEKTLIERDEPDRWRLWTTEPDRLVLPGGESLASVRERSAQRTLELVALHEGDRFAVVTHRSVLKVLGGALLGLREGYFWRFYLDNAG